ncbi:MAG: tRNA pseudouridine(38-40) synthase TruA [Clostridium sp.]
MRNIKLIIEYDGTNYCGWQKQKHDKTVQGTIEKAIKKITNEDVDLLGSSRTDAGVHARGMVANFKTESRVKAEKFREAINSKLPEDISIICSELAPEEFHARYDSVGKTYSYRIVNRYENVALQKDYLLHVKDELDREKMKEACQYFIGMHDFKAFRSKGSSVKTSVRTIKELYIEELGNEIKVTITADGFLYNMVRIIVGTLIQVGRGKIAVDEVKGIIEQGVRRKSGPCVAPNGLVLEKVYYL